MKNFLVPEGLAGRIIAGVLTTVLGALLVLSLLLALFTRFEVIERLDDSLQEVGERLQLVAAGMEHASALSNAAPIIAQVPYVDRRALSYQITTRDGHLALRSQNSPARVFDVPLAAGFYDRRDFRVYVRPTADGHYVILVGEPSFHRHEAVQRAILISVVPMVLFFPLIWLLVRWIVRRALISVTTLRNEIGVRGEANLTPIPPIDLPPELATIHAAVNALLERLTMALNTERAFAANAAHELRNPIASLLAQSQLLHESLLQTENRPRIEQIVQQVRRLGRVVEKLLQLSRAASGIALRHAEKVDVPVLIDFLCEEIRQGARILWDDANGHDLVIRADTDAVGILLRNLLENSLAYSPEESIIRVKVQNNQSLVIENDCAALPSDLLQRVSEPFVRGGSDIEGSGLGLAIVQAIARQIGANLRFSSPIPGLQRGFAVLVQFEQPGRI